jgi:2-thiouracil desulfurase
MTAGADAPLRVGVSACLLGEAVRFDGGHKRDCFLVKTLGRFVEWVPVCPELESGLGVPRESMRLVQMHREIRLVTGKTANDHTDTVGRYTVRRQRGRQHERPVGDDGPRSYWRWASGTRGCECAVELASPMVGFFGSPWRGVVGCSFHPFLPA